MTSREDEPRAGTFDPGTAEESPPGSFTGQVSLTFGGDIGRTALAFAGGVLIARVFGPSGKGVVVVTGLLAMILGLLGGLGVEAANIYLAGRREHPTRHLIGNSVLVALVAAPPLMIAALVALPALQHTVFRGVQPLYIWMVTLALPAVLLQKFLYQILWGQQRFRTANGILVAQAAFDLALLVILVVGLRKGLVGAIVPLAVRPFTSTALCIWALRQPARVYLPRLRSGLLRRSLHYGVRAQLGGLVQFVNYRLDMLLVNALLGSAPAGVYSAAVAVSALIWLLPDAIGRVVFPRTAVSGQQTANRFTPLVCRQTLLISVVSAAVLAVLARFLIPAFYGSRFADAVVPFLVLLPGVIMSALTRVLGPDLMGRGKPQYNSYAAAIAAVATIILDITLIPRMGVIGAALASTIAYGIAALALLIWFLRFSGAGVSQVLLPRWADWRELRLRRRQRRAGPASGPCAGEADCARMQRERDP